MKSAVLIIAILSFCILQSEGLVRICKLINHPYTWAPSTAVPTTEAPISVTQAPTTDIPTTSKLVTQAPTTLAPVTVAPSTSAPTTKTANPTTLAPASEPPTTLLTTTNSPNSTTLAPVTQAPTTLAPSTEIPTTQAPTTNIPTTIAPITQPPTTLAPITNVPTTLAPTTVLPVTQAPSTIAPSTTPSGPPVACALWTRYNGDNAPSINGFSAGISVISNTTAYVGMGMANNERKPARIQITASTIGTDPKTAGGYVDWTSEAQSSFAEYLVVPDGCTCSWLAPAIASNRAIIFTGDPTYMFAVGKKTFADGRVAIAKVRTNAKRSDYMTQCYNPTSTIEVCNEIPQELLVCETTASTVGKPKVTFATEACGMWSTIGMIDSAAANGFSAGLSFATTATANITAYIGRGQKDSIFSAGRYQVESPTGAYISQSGFEQLVDYGSQWLIVPQGCTCKWMTPDQGRIRKGLMTTLDDKYNFMIGRKFLSNGFVTVTHVNNIYGSGFDVSWEFYATSANSETASYAAEVLVCETLPTPPNACALWTRYNNDDAPSVNGFSAGISYLSNTTAYVGMGMYKNQRLPGRIQIITSTVGSDPKTAGGYLPCGGNENNVPYTEYLVVPNGCTCQWLTPSIASNRAIILSGDPAFGYAVGRKTFADGRVAIAKVMTFAKRSDYMTQWFNPTSNSEINEPATEILVCDTVASTAAAPKVTFPSSSEACGMWSTIGMANTAATNGFAAGPSFLTTATANSTAYVGRGQKINYFIPGRYQVESPTGTYTTPGGYGLVDYGSEFLIVPQNCTCTWIAPAAASTRKGLVTAPDQLFNFLVGRKQLGNGIVQVSHVNYKYTGYALYTQWYANLAKTESQDIANEVLVCAVNP